MGASVKLTIEWNEDGASFEDGVDDRRTVVASIATAIGNGRESGRIVDINGNTIGEWELCVDSDEGDEP